MSDTKTASAQAHTVGQVPLQVYTYDSVLPPTAPIYVACHGLLGAIALEDAVALPDWRSLSQQLRLVRYDAYGHGQSGGCESPARYDWATQADDMAAVLDWVHQRYPARSDNTDAPCGPDIVLGGCSMSAGVALHLMSQIGTGARAVPAWFSRIKALALTLPPAGWAERAEIAVQYRRLSTVLREEGMAPYLRMMALKPPIQYIVADRPNYPDQYRQHQQTLLPAHLATLFEGAAQVDYPTDAALATIEVPVLLLARQADAVHPVSCAEKLSVLLPNAALLSVNTCNDIESWPGRVARLAFAETARAVLADVAQR